MGGSWLGKKQDPISKITRAKRAGGVVQAVEYLPNKHKALTSNPNTVKKKKKNCELNVVLASTAKTFVEWFLHIA
jgi:hypothetical protein